MALFNHATKEVTAKLVYYGPGLCGKTSNLQWIHDRLAFRSKGKLVSLATQTDRTLFFDFLPLELGSIRGMRARVQIYTVPGQVFYEATRRMVLKGCDAVVFIADSQAAMLDANAESQRSLRQNLLVNEIDPSIPQVIQYNKRDLPTALPLAVLNERLNPRGMPAFEAVAIKGTGVEETLRGITKLLFQWLSRHYGEGTSAGAPAPDASKTAAQPVPAIETQARPTAPAPSEPKKLTHTLRFAPPEPVASPAPVASPGPAAPAAPAAPSVPAAAQAKPAAAAPPPQAPARPVFADPAAPPAPNPAPKPPVAPVAAAPPAPKPPAPISETAIIRAQPVTLPRGTTRPTVSPTLPPGLQAPRPARRASERPTPSADPLPRAEGLRPDQWFYLLDGAQRGPIDVEDLIDLVLTSIPESTKVWHTGLEGWVLANQVRQIADEIPPPIPVPGLARAYGDEEMPDFNTVPTMLRTVLIADEDAAFRKYLAMPLAAQGFTIHEAADGAAAWQIAVQNRPWMILADVSMPELDGFEFCRRVRSHPMLSRLPLLFISGSDKYKDRYRALQIGADDFLSKNMPVRELLMRIQLLMTRYSDLAAAEPQAGAAEGSGAFQGRIEVFGAPALLQMCGQGGLTGIFTSIAEDVRHTATVMGFREGHVVSATCGTLAGAEAVYAFLAWTKGSFKFTPGDPGEGQPLAQSVEHLLLEGCRLLDESQMNSPQGGAPAP
jgi:CheY-like chemotaxis protein/signal recognition particle receptor subunit beta